jgi:hypothetical protein
VVPGGGAAADGDWKTTSGRLGLEERWGRRLAVGETGTTIGSRRSEALRATADGEWKTIDGRPRLEERRGRRPTVGEAGHSEQWRERMMTGIRMEIGAEENKKIIRICFYTYLTSWPTCQFRFAGIQI